MSRIGKAPVELPQGVQVSIEGQPGAESGQTLVCKGPKGSLRLPLDQGLSAKVEGGKVLVERHADSKLARAMHGTTRALVSNMVEGVTRGFSKKLEIVGVGYGAVLKGKTLALNVGFANTIEVAIPEGVTVQLADPTHLEVSGPDKQAVGQIAADIRAARKPEPYKGKGVRYVGEFVRRKAGKATTATAGTAGTAKN
jgi:large subunit ribosomal protein L6